MIALALTTFALAQDPTTTVAPPTAPAGPDRSRAPDVIPPTLLDLAEPAEIVVGEGVRLVHVRVPGVRKVYLTVFQHRGGLDFDGTVTSTHLASGWLQDVASTERDGDDVAIYEDLWDVDVWTAAGGLLRAATHLEVPAEDFGRGTELLRDLLQSPAYPKKDVAQWRVERERALTEEDPRSPGAVVSAARTYAWFPADSPYGTRPDLDDIGSVKTKALLARHAALRDAPVTVLAVGDIDSDAVIAGIQPALDGFATPGAESAPPAYTPPSTSRVVAIDMPDAEQATLSLRLAAPLQNAPERVAFEAVTWAYGGHFMSRINKNLREERGLTYGAGARYDAGRAVGTFGVSVDVPADKVGEAVTQIEAELTSMVASGVTESELAAWTLEDIGWWNQVNGSTDSAYGFYESRLLNQERVADVRARLEAGRTMTPAATAAAAATWLGPNAPRLWVIVGPRAVVESQLPSGIEILWLTPEDAVLGRFE